nr:hypothetical protein [Flavobacterium sp. LB-N7T]
MKAIHNKGIIASEPEPVGNYKLKYNFESNSQQLSSSSFLKNSWKL